MIRIPSRRELLLGLGVAALSSAFIGIPGPAGAEAQGPAHDAVPGVVLGTGTPAP